MDFFPGFDPDSTVWIYQCNRPFTPDETILLQNRVDAFTTGWTAHDKQLHAKGIIVHNRFIILCVDKKIESASGCSIDKSVHFIRQVEKDLSVFLLNRLQVAYMDHGTVMACPLPSFISLYESGNVNDDTLIFNNAISTLKELNNSWQIPVRKSWIFSQLPRSNKTIEKVN